MVIKGGDDLQRNIKILVVEPNKEPVEKIIHNRLKDKQHIVGGLIEYASVPSDDNALVVCNEEGKLLGLKPNRKIGNDIIAGTFLIVGDNDTGEDRSLTKEQIEKYKNVFGKDSIIKSDKEHYDYDCEISIN